MLKNKIQEFIKNKTGEENKKSLENLVIFLILLIITIIAINTIWNKDEKQENSSSNYKVLAEDAKQESNKIDEIEYDLEKRLESVLGKMTGVGKVKVLITYSQTSSIIPMYSENENTSTTEETDSSGGTRKQKTSNVNKEVITDGQNNAITKTVLLPKVEGAIVIAEGGENANVKSNIIQAVSAVTGVATYKVQVFQMK